MGLCVVSGKFVSPQGSALSGATVRFNVQSPILDPAANGNLIVPKEISTTTATDGSWSLSIQQQIAGTITLDLNPTASSPSTKYFFSVVTPSSGLATFASVWVESGSFTGSSTTPAPASFASIAGQLNNLQLPSLPDAQVWIGDITSQAQPTSFSGDVSLSDDGSTNVNTVGGALASTVRTGVDLANAATSTNTVGTLVKRDSSGNFSAGTITANLTGNVTGNATTATSAVSASTAINATNFTASLVGDVTGSQSSTTVSKINGVVVSGTTGTGNVAFSTSPTFTSPVVGTQTQLDGSTKAASTAYVDVAVSNAVAGVNPAVAVKAATTAASDTSSLTYNNGVSGIGATFTGSLNTAIVIDGITFTATGQRLLVKDDTQSPSGAFNGVYTLSQVQTVGLPPIFTRASDYNSPADINSTGTIPIISGTTNATTSWVQTAQITAVGTDSLSFTKFTRNPADYLLKSNNLSDVNSASTAFASIAPAPSTSGNVLTSNGSSWVSQSSSSVPAAVSASAYITAFYSFS